MAIKMIYTKEKERWRLVPANAPVEDVVVAHHPEDDFITLFHQ
jgi:hypothetical protein